MGAPMEEVPSEHTKYDAGVTRHFLTGEELTADELTGLLDRADFLKQDRWASAQLAGRSVALVFEKPSTRTRISFEVGVRELGGNPLVLRVAGATPAELAPDPAVVERAGDSVLVTQDPAEAAEGAHALYTDVWVSMGDEAEAGRLRSLLGPYQLNEQLLDRARPDAVVLHCLPAHPAEEITEGLLYG